jgi:hypothetical protein
MIGTEDRIPCGEIKEQGEFSPILMGCTRKDPAQRFKSVRAVLDAILSIDLTISTPPSAGSVNFIETLGKTVRPNADFWVRLADYTEHEASSGDQPSIFKLLSTEHIQNLCTDAPDVANRIGALFASWVRNSAFNFDYCDALANRLEDFYNMTDFDTKIECLMSMLSMGTSHNRWFVERKFMHLCGPAMDGNLAKRLAIQFRIEGISICIDIDHLERSISASRNSLHPTLIGVLGQVCI